MVKEKDLKQLATIAASIETQGDLESLYHTLEPLKIGVHYYTDWVDKKVDWLWNHANIYNNRVIDSDAKDNVWKSSEGNFRTFELLAKDYFSIHGTKGARILELINSLFVVKWEYKDKFDTTKLLEKGFTLKPLTEDSQSQMIGILDGTNVTLKGVRNANEINQLVELVTGEKFECPYYFEHQLRDKRFTSHKGNKWKIYLNGNIEIYSDKFREGLKPYLQKWIETCYHTMLYKL